MDAEERRVRGRQWLANLQKMHDELDAMPEFKKPIKHARHDKFRHSEAMGEISGLGGGYEDKCQNMLSAGVEWLQDHPDADINFTVLKGVFGFTGELTEDAQAMQKAMLASVSNEEGQYDITGAMEQAVLQRLVYVSKHGWEKYCADLTRMRAEKQEAE